MAFRTISQDRLKAVLDYDPETGIFRWTKTFSGHQAGAVAGGLTGDGYLRIYLFHSGYQAHRLAFVWMTGTMPEGDIDHADGDRANNRWSNLRPAERCQNLWNAKRCPKNTSGFKGVHFHKIAGKWQAGLKVRGTLHYLGLFGTPEEAHAAWRVAAARLHGEFMRAG